MLVRQSGAWLHNLKCCVVENTGTETRALTFDSEKAWPRCSSPFMYGYGKLPKNLPLNFLPCPTAK